MYRKRWKVVVGVVAAAVIAFAGFLVARLVLAQNAAETTETEVSEGDLNEVYGYVEEAVVADLVEKFDQVVMNEAGWELMPTDDETMVVHDGLYWYPLYEDVALVVVPVEFGDDTAKDAVLSMLIYTDKDSANRERALEYLRCLIQANDAELSAEEVEDLMAEAETLRERGEMANRGEGLFVAVNEADNHIEYQVVRNYKK